jgi:hypothetical protein
MTNGSHEGGKSMSGFVENAKGVVSIVRDGLITILLILLLAMPEKINESLETAGFVEGNFAGLQWKKDAKKTVEKNNQELLEATGTISNLQTQLTTTQEALKQSETARKALAAQVTVEMPGTAAAELATSVPAPETSQIVEQNRVTLNNAITRSSILHQQIRANDKLLARVAPPAGN